jgi:hypothetical protein
MYEQAVFGSFCGNSIALKKVAQNRNDRMWGFLKSHLFAHLLQAYIKEKEEKCEEFDSMYTQDYDGVSEELLDIIKNKIIP